MTKPQLIIPSNTDPRPETFEISAAMILAQFFDSDVKFIARQTSTTPDIEIAGVRWEIKSPIGNGKNNLKHQFSRAMKQSKNIVIDACRSKIDVRNIRRFLVKEANARTLKRLLFVTKDEKVEVIK